MERLVSFTVFCQSLLWVRSGLDSWLDQSVRGESRAGNCVLEIPAQLTFMTCVRRDPCRLRWPVSLAVCISLSSCVMDHRFM